MNTMNKVIRVLSIVNPHPGLEALQARERMLEAAVQDLKISVFDHMVAAMAANNEIVCLECSSSEHYFEDDGEGDGPQRTCFQCDSRNMVTR